MVLRKCRNQYGLKLPWLAAELNASKSTLSDWEKGVFLPRKRSLDKLIKALGCNDVEAQELWRLWREAQAEKHPKEPREAIINLIAQFEKIDAGSGPNSADRSLLLVNRSDWADLRRLVRSVKRLHGQE